MGSAARFFGPTGLAVDSLGNIFVVDFDNDTIRKITPSGVVTTVAGTSGYRGSTDGTGSAAWFNLPLGIAVDGSENLYVSDQGNETIRYGVPVPPTLTSGSTANVYAGQSFSYTATYRHFETVGSNLVHESAVGGLVINSRDITDRVSLEDKLRQSQKLEALGQLVGGIAHNFNNILTATMMRLGFLLDNGDLPADVLAEIEALEKEAKRTAALTKKLVLFGQQQFLRKEPVNMRECIGRLLPEITDLMGKDIQAYVTGVSSTEWVEADAGLLDQVILSLCANARDAMATGGALIIEIAEFERAAAAAPKNGGPSRGTFVRLSFKDTGCGMDSSVRQHLFEPFFTTKKVGEAQGMGLAVVHGIVQKHRGWMEVESAPGLGSTFRVYLPKAAEPARS